MCLPCSVFKNLVKVNNITYSSIKCYCSIHIVPKWDTRSSLKMSEYVKSTQNITLIWYNSSVTTQMLILGLSIVVTVQIKSVQQNQRRHRDNCAHRILCWNFFLIPIESFIMFANKWYYTDTWSTISLE